MTLYILLSMHSNWKTGERTNKSIRKFGGKAWSEIVVTVDILNYGAPSIFTLELELP